MYIVIIQQQHNQTANTHFLMFTHISSLLFLTKREFLMRLVKSNLCKISSLFWPVMVKKMNIYIALYDNNIISCFEVFEA